MIEAAAREFAHRGYAGASLAGMMKRIGGQPGHLYYYFPTKDSIAKAVIDQELSRWSQRVREERYEGLVGLEILADLVARIAHDLAAGDPTTHATVTLAADPSVRDAGITSPVPKWVTHVSALIDEAIGTRQMGCHLNPSEEAVSFISALLGLYSIRHEATDAVGSVYSMATRQCISFFENWGCGQAVEVVEAALARAAAGARELGRPSSPV
jgi:AcrR family transcriptional regulator